MRKLRIYFSIVLLALMSFSVVPKEFIHDLYDHSDTVEDVSCLKGILHVECIHHHCEMLNYAAFPYDGTAGKIPLNNLTVIVSRFHEVNYGFVKSHRYNLSRFRAPPMA